MLAATGVDGVDGPIQGPHCLSNLHRFVSVHYCRLRDASVVKSRDLTPSVQHRPVAASKAAPWNKKAKAQCSTKSNNVAKRALTVRTG